MHIEIDLERLLAEKNISKNRICADCQLERTQFNRYCRSDILRMDLAILARLCAYLECTPNDILALKEDD